MDKRYIFPVFAIVLPITETVYHPAWTEEVYTGKDNFEIWDQTCETVCTCSEWSTAEYIAGMMNHHNQ